MPRTPALDPLFTAVDAAAFAHRHLANRGAETLAVGTLAVGTLAVGTLAVGTLAAVRVPDLLDPA
ncbi:hypothetical protein ACFVHB_29720 [Kitasatospora sp. NPDC127111]|uniref:hypothetical protein n=1 Tax=Kitasatospora sp. NPDC127111 TaxID=3345363 RepID=UPI003624E335